MAQGRELSRARKPTPLTTKIDEGSPKPKIDEGLPKAKKLATKIEKRSDTRNCLGDHQESVLFALGMVGGGGEGLIDGA